MIREATILDLPKVFEISKEDYLTAVNHQRIYTWNDERAIASLKFFIMSNDATILIDEQNGIIKGFFIAELTSPPGGVDITASDVALFVRPKYQGSLTAFRLIKRYETWAKEKGARNVELGVSSGVKEERTLSLYSRLGYRPSSTTYIKEI